MDFERKNSNELEEDESPEIADEALALDKRAGEVALELEDIDIENMEPEERKKVIEKLLMVAGGLIAVGGAGKAIYDIQSLSMTDFHGLEDGIRAVFTSKMGFNISSALVGLSAFLANYWKLGDAFKKEKGKKNKMRHVSAV